MRKTSTLMSRGRTWSSLAVAGMAVVFVIVAGGCGGGGGPAGEAGVSTGDISVSVTLPPLSEEEAHPQDLPAATRSLVFYVYGSDRSGSIPTPPAKKPGSPRSPAEQKPLVKPLVLIRQSGERKLAGRIAGVPAGDVLLVAYAYASTNPPVTTGGVNPQQGREQAIAEAVTRVRVLPGKTARVRMTADRLPVEVSVQGPDRLVVKQRATFVATAFDADGQVVLGVEYEWQSSNTAVLTLVDKNPTFEGQASGTATVQAIGSYCGHQWTASKQVRVVRLGAVDLQPANLNLTPGQVAQLTATVTDEKGQIVPDYPVTYVSSCYYVAKVDGQGQVTAGRPYAATIMAQAAAGQQKVVDFCHVLVGAAPSNLEVHGQVYDQFNHLMPGARAVTCGGTYWSSDFSDASGQYSLPGLTLRDVVVTCGGPGHATANDTVLRALFASGSATVNFHLDQPTAPPAVSITSSNVSATGMLTLVGSAQNLDQPFVVFIKPDGSETVVPTDATGHFSISLQLVPGTSTVYVRAMNALGSDITAPLNFMY